MGGEGGEEGGLLGGQLTKPAMWVTIPELWRFNSTAKHC